MKLGLAGIMRKVGRKLVCIAESLERGSQSIEIVIDSGKREMMLAAVTSECDLERIKEIGRQERMKRAQERMVLAV